MIDIESKTFHRHHPDFGKLLSFGFVKGEGGLALRREFMDGDFYALLHISNEGKIEGKVFETFSGEEYRNIRIETMDGAFVSEVREKYCELLEEIREKCFDEDVFTEPQANRLAAWIQKTYGIKVEFPWEKLEEYGVFRHPESDKWFGIVMYLPRNKVTEGEGNTDIINSKLSPETMKKALEMDGIFPAYHMNKKYWVSILLDETVSDETLYSLLSESYRLVSGREGRVAKAVPAEEGPEIWLIPANYYYFDVGAAFRAWPEISWHQRTHVKKGDLVYIYISKPVAAVCYKCMVTETDIPCDREGHGKQKVTKEMKIRLLQTFNPAKYPKSWLIEQGIVNVRSAMKVTGRVEFE